MTAYFNVRTAPLVDGCLCVLIAGELDLSVADLVRQVLVDASRAEGVSTIEVDLSRALLLDAAGIGALLAGRAVALARGRTLRVRGASGIVREVLEITGTEAVLNAKSDADDHDWL